MSIASAGKLIWMPLRRVLGVALVVYGVFCFARCLFLGEVFELDSFMRELTSREQRMIALKEQITLVSGLIAGFVGVVSSWGIYSVWKGNRAAARDAAMEIFLKGVAPLAAALFFAYQIIAGSLFATVSVSATVTRCVNATDHALLSVSLERGDKWVVDVPLVTYLARPSATGSGTWFELAFPRRAFDPNRKPVSWLRLGPGERTDTMGLIKLPVDNVDTTIDVRADSYAVWWPTPSQALTRLVLPAAPAASSTSSPIRCHLATAGG